MTIFTKNVKASWYKTVYVDAFAGTGYRTTGPKNEDMSVPLFGDREAASFQQGSAFTALETEPSFDQYLFIEQSPDYAAELESLRHNFPDKAHRITVITEEANTFLRGWCLRTNWRTTPVVVFLDPYGMQVEWKTIETIAHTEGIDLWILFPLGQAVNRLLTKHQPPPEKWAERLTIFFGTDAWRDVFYRKQQQLNLFGPSDTLEKNADFDSIGKFFISRLETVFAKVATNPLPLFNSRNVPIFSFWRQREYSFQLCRL